MPRYRKLRSAAFRACVFPLILGAVLSIIIPLVDPPVFYGLYGPRLGDATFLMGAWLLLGTPIIAILAARRVGRLARDALSTDDVIHAAFGPALSVHALGVALFVAVFTPTALAYGRLDQLVLYAVGLNLVLMVIFTVPMVLVCSRIFYHAYAQPQFAKDINPNSQIP